MADSSSPERPAARLRPVRRRLMRGEPVTDPLPLRESLRHTPYRDPRVRDEPDEIAERRRRMELSVRVGELLLRCGASTRDVESAVIAVAASLGLRRLEVDITNQSLLVQGPAPSGGEPLTALRVVRTSTRDFARLAAVHDLVDRIITNDLDVEQAGAELKQLQREPRLYPRWLVTLGYGGLAGSVAALLGGGIVAIAVAVVSAIIIDRVGRGLSRRGLPYFYVCAAGGAISTVLGWLAFVLSRLGDGPWAMSTVDFAYAVAGGIVVQLPGRSMTSAVEDAITGYPVTGAGRMLTTVLTGAGIIIGVAFGLSLTLRLDRALDLELSTPGALRFEGQEPLLWLVVLCGATGALASAITMRSRLRMLLPTALLGMVGLLVSQTLTRYIDLGATSAVAVGAIAMGLLGRVTALRLGAPPMVLVVPAISPLLPGLRIFQGMYESVSGTVVGEAAAAATSEGVVTLVGAAGVALALSTGIVLGDLMSSPLDRSAVRRRRARRR